MDKDPSIGPQSAVTLREITAETVIPICNLSDTLSEEMYGDEVGLRLDLRQWGSRRSS